MKPFRLVLIVACFSIICALFSGVGSVLGQDEVRVSLLWHSQDFYQGSDVTLTMFFINDLSEELSIFQLGLHFDWMSSDDFVGLDMSDNPVVIPSLGTHYFNPIIIHIPENVSVGEHSYFVALDGLRGDGRAQGEFTIFSWEDSQNRTLYILDSEEEVYNEAAGADNQQDQLLIIVGVVVVVIVAILIIILMRPWKKKKTKAPVDQSAEA